MFLDVFVIPFKSRNKTVFDDQSCICKLSFTKIVDVASCRIEVIRLSSYTAVIDLGIDF